MLNLMQYFKMTGFSAAISSDQNVTNKFLAISNFIRPLATYLEEQ